MVLGNAKFASTTTVKAELRRLMLEQIHTGPGQYVTNSFTVNVRRPQIAGGGEVHLKDREKTTERAAWDDKLTLEFDGDHPSVAAISIERADVPSPFSSSAIRLCATSPPSRGEVGARCCRAFSSRMSRSPTTPNPAIRRGFVGARAVGQNAEPDEARRLSVPPVWPQ